MTQSSRSSALTEQDRICSAFEAALAARQKPSIEDCLATVPESGRSALLCELLKLDVAYRRQAGEAPALEEYQQRFPGHVEVIARVFRVPVAAKPEEPATPPVAPSQTDSHLEEAHGPGGHWPVVPDYEILDELKQGGMGVIYRARQLSLDRVVALKMIRADRHVSAEARARFHREANAVARLRHSNIIRIYELKEHNGQPYFSMELIDGGTLADRLKGSRLPLEESAGLIETLARAMHYAHGQGVVHRDLKPANVLLSFSRDALAEREPTRSAGASRLNECVPIIIDFGLVKLLDEDPTLTGTWQVMGTPDYMAPEQTGGHPGDVGAPADIWALGVMLYEALTGCLPFRGRTTLETLDLVRTHDPVPPSQCCRAVPLVLEAICLKCLEKEPGKRYESAGKLADDLAAFRCGEPTVVVPEPEWDRQVRWARRAGYELVELSGCSSLGLIFTARRLTLFNQLVTLKTFSALTNLSAERMERFRAQAEVTARLHHPGIEQVYDFGECQGRHYCSVEYVEGGRLADRFLGTPQPEQEAAGLIQALAEAVHYAHQQGTIHGDLRPNNVLLTCDGKPKITGFGLVRLLRGDRAGQRPSIYMAPEQVRGDSEAVGPAADVHALGAMLYELLTGESPFLAATIDETLRRIEEVEPPPPGQVRQGLPAVLDQICLRCLRKNPQGRYPSAQELADDLRRWLRSQRPVTDAFNLVPGYRLERELGRGGLGVVHEATHLKQDLRVALKVYQPGAIKTLRPIKAAAQLRHPNLVAVRDWGERDGLVYVAEELIEGPSLDRLMAAGPQQPEEAARLLETLARALHHAHTGGIVHRNLKPKVVLLAAPPAGVAEDTGESVWGIPKVSSFDLAVLRGDTVPEEDQGQIIGTARYMAPEQATGHIGQISPATDIHALGILLHELLTGQPLFTGATPQELLEQVVHRVPRPPTQVRPGMPHTLDAICLKCLEKQPGRRYPTAAALADELHHFLARRGSLWHRLLGWARGRM